MKFEASICVCILNIGSSIGERRWRTRWKRIDRWAGWEDRCRTRTECRAEDFVGATANGGFRLARNNV